MRHSAHRGEAYALTLAFTTFVLFQFFNVFNARAEHHSAFNRQFFSNGKLWAALGTVVGLQALAFAVASSILLLDEGRKLFLKLLQCSQRKPI